MPHACNLDILIANNTAHSLNQQSNKEFYWQKVFYVFWKYTNTKNNVFKYKIVCCISNTYFKYMYLKCCPSLLICCQMQNWYKNAFVMQSYYLNFLICRFELFCRTVVTRDSNRSSGHLSSMSPYSVSYRTNLPSMKTHRYEAAYVWG